MKNKQPQQELTKLSELMPTIQDQKEKYAAAVGNVAERAEQINPEYASAAKLSKKMKLPAPIPFEEAPNPNNPN